MEFANICDRVGKNAINSEDEEFFNSRVITSEIELEKSNSNFKTGEVTIIVTTNHAREKINLYKLRSLLPNEKEYTCLSKDNSINKKNFDSTTTALISHSKTKGLMLNLIIREGAPVTITTNHSTARYREDGIMNGAGGFIDYIQTSKKDPELVEIIWVKFHNSTVGQKCYRGNVN